MEIFPYTIHECTENFNKIIKNVLAFSIIFSKVKLFYKNYPNIFLYETCIYDDYIYTYRQIDYLTNIKQSNIAI